MINKNSYIKYCSSSSFTVLFDNFNRNKDIKFIHSMIKYPNWNLKNIDILQYVTNLDELKKDPKTYFIFDASCEGFSPFDPNFFDILYYSCKVNNVSPKKIIFVSSNMKDIKNIKNYNKLNSIKESINVFCFLSFKKTMSELVQRKFGKEINKKTVFKYFKNQTEKEYKGKYGLSLSRVNRKHRIFANFTLHDLGLSDKFNISQNRINHNEAKEVMKTFNIDFKKFSKWQSLLPLIVDTDNFEINYALTLNSHLHNSTLFQIVNETHTDNWKNTSLFYSEKTFQSIAHMQPFLIFGQKGCNYALEKFGFKLYHDLFDYSFDNISDTRSRYLALLESVKTTIKKLDSMSRKEQIEWKFSQEDILKHNFDCLMNEELEKKRFKRLIKSL